jgi:hypothetical protein
VPKVIVLYYSAYGQSEKMARSGRGRQPVENELAGAGYQGRKIAETAKKLPG